MPLNADQPIIPDGAPAGGIQLVKSQPNIIMQADRNGQPNQSIPSGVSTIVQLNQEQIDFGGYFDPLTFTWTPPIGLYSIAIHAEILLLDSNEEFIVRIMKNGLQQFPDSKFATFNDQSVSVGVSGLVSSGAGADTFTMEVEHDHGSNLEISSNPGLTYIIGTLYTQSLVP